MLTYAQVLQTISTLCGVIGTASTIYVTYLAKRLHGTIQDVHQTMKERQEKDA